MQRLAKCRPCRGSGRVKNWAGRYVPCSICRGTGTVLVGGLAGLGMSAEEGWQRVAVSEAQAQAIWPLVVATYTSIGMPLRGPEELADQPVWFVFGDPAAPLAFQLAKTTPYGRKFTLSGHNGTRAGKVAAIRASQTRFNEDGNYAEVSHTPEKLVREANGPVVCGVDAAKILGKAIVVEPDGIHYTRHITNVGPTTKVMVGRPLRVPTQPYQSAHCAAPGPVSGGLGGFGGSAWDDDLDARLAHATMRALR